LAETHLAEQFDDLDQQRRVATLGMWVFLATEVIFFGALFVSYTVYRTAHYEAFAEGSRHMDLLLGSINTAVLVTSSLTMALAVHAAQRGKRKAILAFLSLTMVLGAAFVALKFLEYAEHLGEGLNPGPGFSFSSPRAAQVHLFISFYFVMTGAHALHMVIGLGLLSTMFLLAWKGRFTEDYHNPVEVTGLYWHFVDIVWIFLYPLFYLIDIHH
jgi:cytochrome c oxidase subunit III